MLLLTAATLLFAILFTIGHPAFGSQVDWMNQHSVLPEYFRQLFYETGSILPEFAPQLGGGQNIFHFAYYGLLNPVLLPSYLFPGLPMTAYLSISSVLLAVLSGILCYLWLRSHKLPSKVVLVACFLFQFSASFLYHSHKQVMFVNYMPFLILAFIGVDRFFEQKKSGILMTGIFFMIMTSYFFSIGGLLALTVYGIYSYLKTRPQSIQTANLKQQIFAFLKAGISFALRIVLPVGCAALLLLPSLAAILNGRSAEAISVSLTSLLLPKFSLETLLYSPYGIGLTAVSLLGILRLILSKKPGERVLAGLLFTLFSVPVILYLLNGGLYLRGKVFLPFLPLLTLITGLWFAELYNSLSVPISKTKQLSFFAFLFLLLILDRSVFWLAFVAECAFLLFGVIQAKKQQKFLWCCLPSCLVCFIIFFFANISDPLITNEQYERMYGTQKKALYAELKSRLTTPFCRLNDFTAAKESCNLVPDQSFWQTSLYSSTYDAEYQQFHIKRMGNARNTSNNIICTDSNNLLFQTFMGVQYVISENGAPAGYREIARQGSYVLYENTSVFPIAWGSSSLLGMEEFESLSSSEQSVALLERIIVQNAPKSGYVSPLKKEMLSLPMPIGKNGTTHAVSFKDTTSVTLPLSKPLNQTLLLLSFSFAEEPKKEDIVIRANEFTNRLTRKKSLYSNLNFDFDYVISEAAANKELTLEFSPGTYEFELPKLYSLDISTVTAAAAAVTPLALTESLHPNSVLSGTIFMKEDGYFTASIPYDSGFTAYVDGQEQKTELVNTAFLGFPLSAGEHTIELVYHAPLLAEGKLISLISLFFLTGILCFEHAKGFQKRTGEIGHKHTPVKQPEPVLYIQTGEH